MDRDEMGIRENERIGIYSGERSDPEKYGDGESTAIGCEDS